MFNFIFIAKLDGAQKLQCLLRDQGFWPVNLYNAEKAEEPCFFFLSILKMYKSCGIFDEEYQFEKARTLSKLDFA